MGQTVSSVKVQWDFLLGPRSRQNIIGPAEQTMSELSKLAQDGQRRADRQREQDFRGHLGTLEGLSRKSGETLVQQKQAIAKKGAGSYRAGQVARGRAAAGAGASTSKIAASINKVTQSGERAYKILQKRRKEMGQTTGAASFEQDLRRFGQLQAKQQAAEIKTTRSLRDEKKKERDEAQASYDEVAGDRTRTFKGEGRDPAAERRHIKQLDDYYKGLNHQLQAQVRIKREGEPYEIAHEQRERNLLKLGARAKQMRQEQIRMEKEIQQTRTQAYQQFAYQMEAQIGQIGEGLRNAFVYATAAITAFYYKLNEVVQTFQQFEQELVNAQSIWQTTNDELFQISDQVVQFGQSFGVEMGKATEGLYQYASAGVEASEAMQMLTHTLTLSMAVQGDHNTLSKLTTQTIMGFGMEMSDAEEVTDKFAHAINKSLIEWDDLASSIKFALPFFISTGQSLDQLLGALQVLTNRALEAGIAGRGLRQALAEFTQHAEDNQAAFRKLGIEILDLEGNMYPLDQIAQQFNSTLGETASDMDVMIALMEDLNVRGATAFIHLVQNADEYSAAVQDLQNSAGESHEMAMIQQQSLAMQIQLVKNALQAPFLMSDEIGKSQGYLNEFAMQMHSIVKIFGDLIVEGEEGNKKLTELGQFLRDFVIVAMKEFAVIIHNTINLMKEWSDKSEGAYGMLSLLTIPLQSLLRILKFLGPNWANAILMYKLLSKILPMNIAQTYMQIKAEMLHIATMEKDLAISQAKFAVGEAELALEMAKTDTVILSTGATQGKTAVEEAEILVKEKKVVLQGLENSGAAIDYGMTMKLIGAKLALHGAMLGLIYISGAFAKTHPHMAKGLSMLAGAIMSVAIAYQIFKSTLKFDLTTAIVIGAAAGLAFHGLMKKMMQTPDMSDFEAEMASIGGGSASTMGATISTGGYNVNTGSTLSTATTSASTQAITPSTLGENPFGTININIDGDVYDGENFSEKVGQVLPNALRNANDVGSI